MNAREKITEILPENIACALRPVLSSFPGRIYELRLIEGQGIFFVTCDGIRFLSASGNPSSVPDRFAPKITKAELTEIIDRAVGYSSYAHAKELADNYISYAAGIRIGIARRASGEISSLNIRLPAAQPVIKSDALDRLLGSLCGGLLIAGAPGTGKTTLLRYCAQRLSAHEVRRVTVIDERSELAGSGGEYFDLGCCTDVIAGVPKAEGIMTALRLMSPEIIICDEIGLLSETESMLEGMNSGVIFVASVHAGNAAELGRKSQYRRLAEAGVFEHTVFLKGRGEIAGIIPAGEKYDEAVGFGGDHDLSRFACAENEYAFAKRGQSSAEAFGAF